MSLAGAFTSMVSGSELLALAPSVTVYAYSVAGDAASGVPEIVRVAASNVKPAGRAGVRL